MTGKKSGTRGCYVTIYFGNTRLTGKTLTPDPAATPDDHLFYFANTPVSTRNLRLIGTVGADTEYIVNYDLEPISGALTVDAALPAYDSIDADYFYYTNLTDGLDILVKDYHVTFPKHSSVIDIFGQPHFQDQNNYPYNVNFKVVLTSEDQRNLLTQAMFWNHYFILIDKNFDASYGHRAFEGPIWSDEQGSMYKGASYLLPIELNVQQFGSYNATTDEITWGFWENT
jgi:hypothetical protein